MNFGEKLKSLRQQRGLSQPELAEAAQIEQSYLSKLENDRSLPSHDVLDRLMAALKVSMDALLDGIDDAEARQRLSAIPQVGSRYQATASAQLRQRQRWMFSSLLTIGFGIAILVAGMGALLFPDVDFRYEYNSTELVPLGEGGQRYESLQDFVEYLIGEQIESEGPDRIAFETQVYRESQKFGDLRFPHYLMEDEFLGTQFHRAANAEDTQILSAAGFANGGSRLFVLTERHSLMRPENGYLLFVGWLLLALGCAGLVQTLLSAVFTNRK